MRIHFLMEYVCLNVNAIAIGASGTEVKLSFHSATISVTMERFSGAAFFYAYGSSFKLKKYTRSHSTVTGSCGITPSLLVSSGGSPLNKGIAKFVPKMWPCKPCLQAHR